LVFRLYNHVYNYQVIDSEFPLCFITLRIMEYSRTSIFRASIIREFGFYSTAALDPHILTFMFLCLNTVNNTNIYSYVAGKCFCIIKKLTVSEWNRQQRPSKQTTVVKVWSVVM